MWLVGDLWWQQWEQQVQQSFGPESDGLEHMKPSQSQGDREQSQITIVKISLSKNNIC